MKKKRELRKTAANVAGGRTIKTRFLPTSRFSPFIRFRAITQNTIQNMKTIHILTVTVLLAVAAPFSATSAECAGSQKDIVAVASGAGSFNTLVAAVKAAGLVKTLQGPGPFTVFAPSDEAFAKLPKGTVEELIKPENKEKLAAILTYHVVSGKVMAADVKTMKAKTVNGKELELVVAEGAVTVNNAKVIKTDVAASNGVIHVIDTVLLPN